MQTLIFTLIGKDKPGLVDSLAKQVYALGGNWLASNFANMAGHFAGFVEIQLPKKKRQALIDIFSRHPDLTIHLVEAAQTAQTELEKVTVEITGNDKPGIVQEVSAILNQFNINISRFDSSVESAPNWGGQLFKALASIEIPSDFEIDVLQEALEAIANDLVVDINLS